MDTDSMFRNRVSLRTNEDFVLIDERFMLLGKSDEY